jgi:hypothetical protein
VCGCENDVLIIDISTTDQHQVQIAKSNVPVQSCTTNNTKVFATKLLNVQVCADDHVNVTFCVVD